MTNDRLADWVRLQIRSLSAYHVPDSSGLIKLDAMENPYGWSPALLQAWQSVLAAAELNRYPDPQARRLKDRLRATMQIPDGAELMLGNGSDEIIQMLALMVGGPGRVILAPEPGFVMFRMIATLTGTDYVGVPLRPLDFALDVEAMLSAIREHRPALVFLASPNNPTGNRFDAASMRAVIEAAPGLVVIDEAYYPFCEGNCLGWLADYDHLLVMRTLSKLGLAGLRLGLIAGAASWLQELDKTRLPYNINVLTQLSVTFALEHVEAFAEQARMIRAEREILARNLSQVPGLTVYPSQANFILFRTPSGSAGKIYDALRTAGVLVKNLDGSHPAVADCLRVTVGKKDENQIFLSALKVVVTQF